MKQIKEAGAGTAAAAEVTSSSVPSNISASSQSPYNSSASTGAGQMASDDANNSMYSGKGGRRRSRRYKRK